MTQINQLNHFDKFSISKNFNIDLDILEEKYLEFQKEFHPDSSTNNDEILNSITINEAYEILKNPVKRAIYLLQLQNIDINDDGCKIKPDLKTLSLILDIKEKMYSSKTTEQLNEIKNFVNKEIRNLMAEIENIFSNKNYKLAAEKLIKVKYLDKILTDLKLQKKKNSKMTLLQIEEPGQNSKEEITVGIDLGTTNSLIGISDNGKIELIPDKNGNVIHPSIVTFGNPKQKIYSIKRLMGKGYDDIKNIPNLPFEIKSKPQQPLKIKAGNKNLTPTEISALILKKLKDLAQNQLGKKVSKAVITVPAYFDEIARNETKNAALLADLEVIRLINEPTAAALAYGLEKKEEGIFAIFDLGGGTFDISILKLQKGIFKVIGVGGDANLGGDDFDNLLVQKIIKDNNLINLSIIKLQKLKLDARKIKEQLVNKKEVITENSVIKLEEFNKLIKNEVSKLMQITTDLIDDLDLEIDSIKGIILVGGSTRIPLIRSELAKIFSKDKVLTDIDPDKVVAIGAAIQAEALTSGSSNLLLDVIPLSLGVEMMGGITDKIIHRNSTIPTSNSKEFTTYADGQTGIKLHIVQGERELAKDCRSLANFEIKNIPPLKAGVARIKVTFIIDADGILTVNAKEETTGNIQKIEVRPSYGLNQNQIKDILIKSAKSSKDDITERLLIEVKVEAKRNILAIKAAIKEDRDLLNKKEFQNIEKQIKKLEKQIQINDYELIKIESEELENSIKEFAGRKMDKYIKKAISGKNIEEIK